MFMIILEKFLITLTKNVCCDPSLEPPCQGSSNEGSQCTFSSSCLEIRIFNPKLP